MSAHIHKGTSISSSTVLYVWPCVCTSLRMTLWQTHLRIVAYSSDAAILHKLWVYSLSLCISFLRNLSTCWEAVLYVFVSRCPCSVGWDSGVFFFKLSRKTFPLLLLTSPHEDWVWIQFYFTGANSRCTWWQIRLATVFVLQKTPPLYLEQPPEVPLRVNQ